MSLLVACVACGKQISRNAISCPSCGEPAVAQKDNPLSDTVQEHVREVGADGPNMGKLFGVIAAIAVVIVIILMVIGSGESAQNRPSIDVMYKSTGRYLEFMHDLKDVSVESCNTPERLNGNWLVSCKVKATSSAQVRFTANWKFNIADDSKINGAATDYLGDL